MTGEPDGDEPVVSKDQDQFGRTPGALADERFARGEASISRYQTTFEALAKQDGAADLEITRQIELGGGIMDDYDETFSALAKPSWPA